MQGEGGTLLSSRGELNSQLFFFLVGGWGGKEDITMSVSPVMTDLEKSFGPAYV